VASADLQPDPPLLGEIHAVARPYSRGGLGFTPPPAVFVGSQDCVSAGETYPPQNPAAYFISGYDPQCWSAAGLAPPLTRPALWFQPEDMTSLPNGATVNSWKDRGTAGDSLDNFPLGFHPTVKLQAAGGYAGVTQVDNQVMQLHHTLQLGNRFDLWGVFIPRSGNFVGRPGLGGLAPSGCALPLFNATVASYQDSVNTASGSYTLLPDKLNWFQLRKNTTQVVLTINSVLCFARPTNALGVAHIDQVAELAGAGGVVDWLEIMVYGVRLSTLQVQQVLTYLHARYKLP